MKKVLATFLAIIMLFLSFSILAFAYEEPFSIENYTIFDLEDMTTAEKLKLINNFNEKYNPYGIMDKQVVEAEKNVKTGVEITPYWKSEDPTKGDQEPNEDAAATHELMTLEALTLLIEKGTFITEDTTQALFIALLFSAASALPDHEFDTYITLWAGHYYHYKYGWNYALQIDNTARTNMSYYYGRAKYYFEKSPEIFSDDFLEAIKLTGCALHYVQDVSEPHHSTCKIASNHSEFEAYVGKAMDEGKIQVAPYWDSSLYNKVLTKPDDISWLVQYTAEKSAPYISYASDDDYKEGYWKSVGKSCVEYGINSSAVMMKILFDQSGVAVKI